MANIPRVAVIYTNYQTGIRRFSVQNEDDLAILPRYNVSGSGDIVVTISSTAVGSRVFVRDTNTTYELNANNEWQKVSIGSSGGSGGGGTSGDEYVDESDIDALFPSDGGTTDAESTVDDETLIVADSDSVSDEIWNI